MAGFGDASLKHWRLIADIGFRSDNTLSTIHTAKAPRHRQTHKYHTKTEAHKHRQTFNNTQCDDDNNHMVFGAVHVTLLFITGWIGSNQHAERLELGVDMFGLCVRHFNRCVNWKIVPRVNPHTNTCLLHRFTHAFVDNNSAHSHARTKLTPC